MPRRRPPPLPPLRAARKRPESVAPMFSSPVYDRLGPAPVSNNRAGAVVYHARIVELITACESLEVDVALSLTREQHQSLARLERRWRRRAAGLDLRWNLVGARAGRLNRDLETQTRPEPDPAWSEK